MNKISKLLTTNIDRSYFKKFLFHNCKPECMNVKLFNDQILFNEDRTYSFPDDKVNVWYVRNDQGCVDYIYNNDDKLIKRAIPNKLVDKFNSGEVILLFGTDSEWEYDQFWIEIFKYAESIGIRKDRINLMTSNFKTSLTEYNTHFFKFSSISDIKFDLGLVWLEKYGDIFPYTDEYIEHLLSVEKTRRYICMNAHYNEHRHFVVYKLFEKQLQDLGHLSFTLGQGINYVDHSKKRMIMEWDRMIEEKDFDIKDYNLSIKMLDDLPMFVKEFGLKNPKDFWNHNMKIQNPILKEITPSIRPWMVRDIKLIEDSYFCIGVETQVNSDNGNFGNFSEKVMIGLITQPTIIVGTSGIVTYLRDLGFETFPELFDESYDDIVETNKRLVKVMNEVEGVCNLPESALKDIYKDLLPKVVHNQNKIFEYDTITDWYNLLESITDNENRLKRRKFLNDISRARDLENEIKSLAESLLHQGINLGLGAAQVWQSKGGKVIVALWGDPIYEREIIYLEGIMRRLDCNDWVCVGIGLNKNLLKRDNYLYWNEFYHNVATYQREHQRSIPFSSSFIETLKSKKRNFDFVSFNRLLKLHRVSLVKEIVNRNLWDISLISVHSEIEGLEDYTPSSVDHKYSNLVYKKSVDKFLRDANDSTIYSDGRVLDDILENVFYSVITESYVDEVDKCITEKIYKFLTCSPFILIGCRGILEHLRELGFKTFPEMFDESYDNIENSDARLLAVVDEIEKFSKLDYNIKMEKYLKSFDNILHNQSIFLKKNIYTYSKSGFPLELAEMIE